jgi:hypothetical protein
MKTANVIGSAPASMLASIDLRMLLSGLVAAAFLILAIYALSVKPETDASAIVASLVSP